MPRRYFLPVLVIAALACNFVSNLPTSNPTVNTIVNTEEAPPASNPILVNEILFHPAEGQPQFIELINTSSRNTSLDGLRIINELSQSYELPASLPSLKSGAFLLILFDGLNRVGGTTIHAELNQFLNLDSGFIELTTSDGTILDHIAWGEGQEGTVRLSPGGKIPTLVSGTTIGRPPGMTDIDPSQWTVYPPEQATPGGENPLPAVVVLLPLSGAVFEQTPITLSWYPAPGAGQYHVQVSTDPSFNSPLIDETVAEPEWAVASLQPGDYVWRVASVGADGRKSNFSPISAFSIRPESSSMVHLASLKSLAPLAVPWIRQHKDTRMLEMEQNRETGAHAWDVDHKVLDVNDLADNMNCSLASIAMVTRFYGGKLSQDRIGFEIFKDTNIGPEWDLNHGRGLNDKRITQAITFALGGAPTYRPKAATPTAMWNDVKKEIDAGRPVIASTPNHVFVITGHTQSGTSQLFTINDPWIGTYRVNLNNPTASNLGNIFDTYWLMPAAVQAKSDEPEIIQDSDGDSVVDFDETQRFHTNPNDPDTDHDNVKDKADIRASNFDPRHGYALKFTDGRDFDKDNIPMELDEDSDGGGCFDGLEDQNGNGKYEASAKETDNFLSKDDTCLWGTQETVYDITTVNDYTTLHVTTNTLASFSVKPTQGGQLQGLARIKLYNMGGSETDSSPGNNCPLVNFSGDPVEWGAVLKGQSFNQPDGSVQVVFQATPPQGPVYTWVYSGCGPLTQENPGVNWTAQSGKLVNGVYDFRQDNPMPENSTGIFYTVIHMEQKK